MKQISSGWTRKLLLLDVHHLDDLLDHLWSAHVQVAEAKEYQLTDALSKY